MSSLPTFPITFSACGERRVVVAGATGRMGRLLIQATHESPGCTLTGALAGTNALGQDAGNALGFVSGVKVTSDFSVGLSNADVLIDFTRPEVTMENLAACHARGIQLVIGTTGFDEAQKEAIKNASNHIAIVMSPNMSTGVNVTFKLVELAARILRDDFDIEIFEAHHRGKVDAPSGTALKMGEVIAGALARDFDECAVYSRTGITGERDAQSIGFSSLRGGDIAGDHTVFFAGAGERIEITHRSSGRSAFAQGSLRAVKFLADKRSGLFDMFDVLDLR